MPPAVLVMVPLPGMLFILPLSLILLPPEPPIYGYCIFSWLWEAPGPILFTKRLFGLADLFLFFWIRATLKNISTIKIPTYMTILHLESSSQYLDFLVYLIEKSHYLLWGDCLFGLVSSCLVFKASCQFDPNWKECCLETLMYLWRSLWNSIGWWLFFRLLW